jgi:hypothetical protein
LYLPHDWRPEKVYPILVEYPGNGGYRNDLGDVSDGTPDSCLLGYGLSGGNGFLWASLPFVEVAADGSKRNCLKWWGNVEETKRYCAATVPGRSRAATAEAPASPADLKQARGVRPESQAQVDRHGA